MNKSKEKNIKIILGLIIGVIVGTGTVFAANSLSANSISIDKSKMSKVETNTLQSALDYLYGQSEKNNLITIESGVLHKSQTYLGIVYLDPTNLENKCTSANSVSTTGTKTGCMKWYIYKDLGDSYKMILDHNTTARLNTSERTGWNNDNINVEYKESNAYAEIQDLKKSVENGGSGWVVEPDIIEASEVAEIVGYSGFTSTNSWFYLDSKNKTRTNNMQGTSNYAWLFDNLGWSDFGCTDYGCNVNNATGDNISGAYWTKTKYGEAGAGSNVRNVNRNGTLNNTYANNSGYGVRPVIEISKSLFS